MRNKYLIRPFVIAFLFLLLILNCNKDVSESPIVAQVDGEKIPFDEFIYNFTMFPKYRPNSTVREARLQHLNYMIDRIILYLCAEEKKLGDEPEIQNHLQYILHKEMLKALYEDEVLKYIQVSDEDAWEEYKRQNIQVHLRHLYAPTREAAWKLYQQLKQGKTFQDLASRVFKDSTLASNGGDLGFVSITDLDPFLADSIYNLRIGEISTPLKSSFGYHVFRVEDVKQSIFLSKEFFAEHKKDFINAVKNRRARVKSAQYLSQVLKGKTVTIKGKTLKKFLSTNEGILRLRQQETPLLWPNLSDEDLLRMAEQSRDILNEVLVEYSDGTWTVGKFLEKLQEMPPMHRPKLTDKETLSRFIINLVRDEYLLKEAYRKNYHHNSQVKQVVEKWKKELLAETFHKSILLASFKRAHPEEWQQRKALYSGLKNQVSVKIDTLALFHDLTPEQLDQRIPALPAVLRETYVW